MHPATPIPPAPPFLVRLSSWLLFGVGGILLLSAIVDLTFVNTDLSVYKDAYTGETGSAFGSLVYATLHLVAGAAVASLGIMNVHGSERFRITTFVLGGIFLTCGGWGNLAEGFHKPLGQVGAEGFARAMPAVYGIVSGVLDLMMVLVLLTALVLLALPPSTRFFHGRRPVGYVTIPVYHSTGDQPSLSVHPPSAGVHPPSAGAHPPTPGAHPPSAGLHEPGPHLPGSHPPGPAREPHTTSIPMADPWAEPDPGSEYRPRHQG